jgi:ABC-2 type transport system ATP-binding protein
MAPAAAERVAEPALLATNLWKRYRRGRWALEGIDLEIGEGRVVALVGPNGAGKSTLLRTFLGFERPTSGTVRVAGVDPWRERGEAIRHIGYIPQTPALYDELSVEEHVDLAAYLRKGLDRDAALARTDELGLPRRSRADELSGGQRAQLSLALVLAAGARILLLDEPLASLDPLARREFLAVLAREVAALRATVVISSHIVRDIEGACQDLVVLVGGRLRLHGSIEAARAGHRVVAPGAIRPDAMIGRFPSDAGERILVRGTPADGREPSLEELVLGYLAADGPTEAGSRATVPATAGLPA